MRLDHLLFREKEKEAECTAGGAMVPRSFLSWYARGELAQLARASALQAEGQGFEPPILHNVPQAEAQGTDDLIQDKGRIQ